MQVHVHIHNHSGLEMDLLQAIHKLVKQMPTKEQFAAASARVDAALEKIGTNSGSLSEAEEVEVLASITALGDKAEAISERSPSTES